MPKHRDVYDVLEENLVAGNQELESNMTFFATAERKERTFGEWIAGVLGIWNIVEIHQVKKMVEGTKKGLMIEVHHVDGLREYAEVTQDDLSKLAKRYRSKQPFCGEGWKKSVGRQRSTMPSDQSEQSVKLQPPSQLTGWTGRSWTW
jgi:hypothetical protein